MKCGIQSKFKTCLLLIDQLLKEIPMEGNFVLALPLTPVVVDFYKYSLQNIFIWAARRAAP